MRAAQHVLRLKNLHEERKYEKERHERRMNEIDGEIKKSAEAVEIFQSGLELDRVEIAESVIYAIGEFGYGDDFRVVRKAIDDVAAGCPILRNEYLGTKNYDRWHHQEIQYRYGYGPRHGDVVFEIGLKNPKQELTDEQQEAVIYYLLNLAKIREATAKAIQKDRA